MILHADFAAENHEIMVKNCRLWLKTMDYGQKPWIMVKNCGLWSKTVIMVKNCGFRSKTTDFAVSEFKTTKLFISFQSRERIQRVSIFFLFSFFWGV